jgi:uncharacterized protein YceK
MAAMSRRLLLPVVLLAVLLGGCGRIVHQPASSDYPGVTVGTHFSEYPESVAATIPIEDALVQVMPQAQRRIPLSEWPVPGPGELMKPWAVIPIVVPAASAVAAHHLTWADLRPTGDYYVLAWVKQYGFNSFMVRPRRTWMLSSGMQEATWALSRLLRSSAPSSTPSANLAIMVVHTSGESQEWLLSRDTSDTASAIPLWFVHEFSRYYIGGREYYTDGRYGLDAVVSPVIEVRR